MSRIYNTTVYSVFTNAVNYHTGPTCEGQQNGRTLTVRQAIEDFGLTPCPNCNPPVPSTYYAVAGRGGRIGDLQRLRAASICDKRLPRRGRFRFAKKGEAPGSAFPEASKRGEG